MTSEKWMDFALDAYNEAHKLVGTNEEKLDILQSNYSGMFRTLMFIHLFQPNMKEQTAMETLKIFFDYRSGKLTDEECDKQFNNFYIKIKNKK
jgi:hypothetical protein